MSSPPSFLKKIRIYFREYASSTSIHGFRYFGENRSYFEKFWWLLVFLISLGTCVYTISLVYSKWENSPVIVTFGTVPYRVHEIPFPAITVCSMAKIKKFYYDILTNEKFRKMAMENKLPPPEQNNFNKILSYVSSICPAIRYRFNKTDIEDLDEELFLEGMEEISPTFKIENCIFLKHRFNCAKLFTRIVTDAGLCYTFNILDAKEFYTDNVKPSKHLQRINHSSTDWSMNEGYSDNATEDSYPFRTLNAGAQFSLQFQLNISSEENFQNVLCGEMISGFIVLLHIPIRIPRLTHHFIRIPLNSSVVAAITPSTMKTSESVMSYPPKTRHCYFPQERHLYFFRHYSQNNCELECLTNATLKECNCVDYYMPRSPNTTICNGRHHQCKAIAERTITVMKLKKLTGCDCLPLCTDITYESSMSQAGWAPINKPKDFLYDFDYYEDSNEDYDDYGDMSFEDDDDEDDDEDENFNRISESFLSSLDTNEQYLEQIENFKQFLMNKSNFEVSNMSVERRIAKRALTESKSVERDLASVRVYFTSTDFIGSQRVELYGPTDFLANFGGLLSLFTGFSILSLMEIIYFLTLRWCFNKKDHGSFYVTEEYSSNNLITK